ncbi:PDZ domain-containing protein [Devosia aurantiaca]|uniref:PDZ domain-containing protein n=1 Tax=Devosia aurantiaca TaxID=2714858 RepID=A0A6M1SVD3_9HYPH|nr:PDZ domain-containing protein [Devosia aurantiaca]NGP19352.1 PDZ domain-containing protein [Devosia aurantiaca]
MRNSLRVLLLLGAAAHLSVLPVAPIVSAYAQQALPAPYVSRAFDAVLLPIDGAVRSAFDLDSSVEGVLVLAVQPGGVADQQGVEPGDVIYEVKGRRITTPISLDEVVYYWLQQGIFDFGFDYYRAGVLSSASAYITLELYQEVIEITEITSWSVWSYEEFSFEEYYEEYSEELIESYESSEELIEETVSSEEFSSEMSEEEDDVDDAVEDDGTEDDAAEDDGSEDDMSEDDGSEDDGSEDDGADDDGSEDDGGEDDGGEDDGGDEE